MICFPGENDEKMAYVHNSISVVFIYS